LLARLCVLIWVRGVGFHQLAISAIDEGGGRTFHCAPAIPNPIYTHCKDDQHVNTFTRNHFHWLYAFGFYEEKKSIFERKH
jgi:hypothetical protein